MKNPRKGDVYITPKMLERAFSAKPPKAAKPPEPGLTKIRSASTLASDRFVPRERKLFVGITPDNQTIIAMSRDYDSAGNLRGPYATVTKLHPNAFHVLSFGGPEDARLMRVANAFRRKHFGAAAAGDVEASKARIVQAAIDEREHMRARDAALRAETEARAARVAASMGPVSVWSPGKKNPMAKTPIKALKGWSGYTVFGRKVYRCPSNANISVQEKPSGWILFVGGDHFGPYKSAGTAIKRFMDGMFVPGSGGAVGNPKKAKSNPRSKWVAYSDKDAAAWAADKSPDRKGSYRLVGTGADLVIVSPIRLHATSSDVHYLPGIYINGRWLNMESARRSVEAAKREAQVTYERQAKYERGLKGAKSNPKKLPYEVVIGNKTYRAANQKGVVALLNKFAKFHRTSSDPKLSTDVDILIEHANGSRRHPSWYDGGWYQLPGIKPQVFVGSKKLNPRIEYARGPRRAREEEHHPSCATHIDVMSRCTCERERDWDAHMAKLRRAQEEADRGRAKKNPFDIGDKSKWRVHKGFPMPHILVGNYPSLAAAKRAIKEATQYDRNRGVFKVHGRSGGPEGMHEDIEWTGDGNYWIMGPVVKG